MFSIRSLAIAAILALTTAACSASFSIGGKTPEQAAVEVIEGEIGDQLDMTLVASCPDLDDPSSGDTFECEANTADGQVVHFNVAIGDDEVNVVTTNVLAPDEVDQIEANVAAQLSAQAGLPLAAEDFECGSTALVVPESGEIDCALTDPANGDVYDALLTLNLSDGSFDVSVAEQPR